MTKYINVNFELKDSRVEKRMLIVEVYESKNNVVLTLATLSVNFEKEILQMAKKIWNKKEIENRMKIKLSNIKLEEKILLINEKSKIKVKIKVS